MMAENGIDTLRGFDAIFLGAVETAILIRAGVERILRFGFEQAMRRRKLASVTKSNAQRHSMVF